MVTGRRDGSLRRHFTTSFGRNGHAWPARSSPPFPRLRLRYNAIFRSLHNKTNHTFLPLFHVSHFFLSCYALEFPRCVMYLGIFSHSIISKLLKRALLYTNSFVCTFVVFDESLPRTNRVPKIAFKINRNYPNSIVHIVWGSSMSDQHATFSLIRSSSVYQCQPLDRPTPS